MAGRHCFKCLFYLRPQTNPVRNEVIGRRDVETISIRLILRRNDNESTSSRSHWEVPNLFSVPSAWFGGRTQPWKKLLFRPVLAQYRQPTEPKSRVIRNPRKKARGRQKSKINYFKLILTRSFGAIFEFVLNMILKFVFAWDNWKP